MYLTLVYTIIYCIPKKGIVKYMKVLYVDITSPVGHVNYNYRLLSILSELCEIDVVFKENYLCELYSRNKKINKRYNIPREYFPEHVAKRHKNKIMYKIAYRYNLYKSMKDIERLVTCNNYDLIFFSSIEVISFCLSTFRPKARYVFVDHAITAIDKNRTKKFFWKLINNNIEVVAMEQYIKDFLENKVKINNKVWLVKHPLPEIYTQRIDNKQKDRNIIFAPSGSNDEKFIEFLISNDKFIKKYKIIIKSNLQQFTGENLEVFNTRIEYDEYYRLMKSCDYVLLPYENNYNYRVSGVFYEAVVLNKLCLINGNNTLKYYVERYPTIVTQFNGYDDFINLLSKLKPCNNIINFNLVKNDYSDNNLKLQLKRILDYEDKYNDK